MGVIQCGLGEVSTAHKFFLPFLYFKKVVETMSNVWPIGAGSLKLGRLAGFSPRFLELLSNIKMAQKSS